MADISTPNLDYNDMLEAWDINDALMGGTLEMRRQGKIISPNGLMKMKTLIKNACLWLRYFLCMKKASNKILGAYLQSRQY
ncbi:Uncharacterised protein [Escherichia coli]|uniref:hypothetical protein n=1 Tax=Escherichia coli TaxID=562 RepID=UPI000ABF497B|nr:Uncharacterised protein [Escherichia coli]